MTFFAITTFHLSRFVNVILFIYMRRNITLLNPRANNDGDDGAKKGEGHLLEVWSLQMGNTEVDAVTVTPLSVDGGGLPD